MLILSRRPGDAIVIDGGIRIVVLASGQRCVRLGIEAPAQIGIVREEIITRNDPGNISGRNGHHETGDENDRTDEEKEDQPGR